MIKYDIAVPENGEVDFVRWYLKDVDIICDEIEYIDVGRASNIDDALAQIAIAIFLYFQENPDLKVKYQSAIDKEFGVGWEHKLAWNSEL